MIQPRNLMPSSKIPLPRLGTLLLLVATILLPSSRLRGSGCQKDASPETREATLRDLDILTRHITHEAWGASNRQAAAVSSNLWLLCVPSSGLVQRAAIAASSQPDGLPAILELVSSLRDAFLNGRLEDAFIRAFATHRVLLLRSRQANPAEEYQKELEWLKTDSSRDQRIQVAAAAYRAGLFHEVVRDPIQVDPRSLSPDAYFYHQLRAAAQLKISGDAVRAVAELKALEAVIDQRDPNFPVTSSDKVFLPDALWDANERQAVIEHLEWLVLGPHHLKFVKDHASKWLQAARRGEKPNWKDQLN